MIPGIIQYNRYMLPNLPEGYPYTSSMSLWFDTSDTNSTVVNSGVCESIQCKATGTIWSAPSFNAGPLVDNSLTNLKNRCLNFDYSNGGLNKRLEGSHIALQTGPSGPITVFMVSKFSSGSSYAVLALQNGGSSSATSAGLGAPSLFRFKSPPGGGVQLHGSSNSYSWSPTPYDAGVFTAVMPDATPANTVLRYKSADLPESSGGSGYLSAWSPSLLGSSDSLYRSAGYLGELIVYNRVLTLLEIIEIETALSTKWLL